MWEQPRLRPGHQCVSASRCWLWLWGLGEEVGVLARLRALQPYPLFSGWEASTEGASRDCAAGAPGQHGHPVPDTGKGPPVSVRPPHPPALAVHTTTPPHSHPGLAPPLQYTGVGAVRAGLRCLPPQKERLEQPCLFGSPRGSGPGGRVAARPRAQGLWQRHRRHALQRRLLERRLLMAVSPWVGDVTLPCTPRRPTVRTRGTVLGPREPAVGTQGDLLTRACFSRRESAGVGGCWV